MTRGSIWPHAAEQFVLFDSRDHAMRGWLILSCTLAIGVLLGVGAATKGPAPCGSLSAQVDQRAT